MKFLRAIVEKTRRQRIGNTHYGRTQDKELQNQFNRSNLKWFGHVKRMDECRMRKVLLEMKMSERRPKGRPCT
jgi:hypothetical protein